MAKEPPQHGGKRKGAGRKPVPPEERKSVLVPIRFTEAEKAELDAAAEGNTSAWARDMLLRAARRASKK